jgi:cell division protein ZapA
MSKEHINIEIAGRSYPLTVSPEEVEGVQEAAVAVDEGLAELKSKFAVKDRIDLFAMTALQLSIKNKQLESGRKPEAASTENKKPEDESLSKSIDDLLLRIDSVMEG